MVKGRSKRPLPGRCHKCNEAGHWKRECPSGQSSRQDKGSKPSKSSSKNNGGQDAGKTSHKNGLRKSRKGAFVVNGTETVDPERWILDSGATDHIPIMKSSRPRVRGRGGEILCLQSFALHSSKPIILIKLSSP